MIRGSIKVGRIAGIQLYVHWTFLILIGWILIMHLATGASLPIAFKGVLLVVAVFVCVLLHELGHALTAKRFGIRTEDITMLPIGGVARLERMPRKPAQELLVAAAGPAVNVVIAAVIWIGLTAVGVVPPLFEGPTVRTSFWIQLMQMNMILVAFNLLPAFPMDGGRILRALLATWLEYARATTIAARIGQVMAVLFGIFGLFGTNPLWVFIAIFIFIGAEAESQMVRITSTLRGLHVRDAMMTKFRALSPDDSLSTAAAELIAGAQQDFPITTDGRVVGLLTRQDLVKGLTERGASARIADVMRPDCQLVNESEWVEKSYEMLRQNNCSSLPVVRDGQLVGMITLENITEWVILNKALRQAAGTNPPPIPSSA